MTDTYVHGAASHSKERKASVSLSLRQQHRAATLTAIPIRGQSHFTNRRRWSLRGHSRHTAWSTPLRFLEIVVLVTPLCPLFRLVWSQPENYNSQSAPGVASGCGVWTVAEKAQGALRSGVALLGPVASCRLLELRRKRRARLIGICRPDPLNDECCQGVPSARGEAFGLPRRRCK